MTAVTLLVDFRNKYVGWSVKIIVSHQEGSGLKLAGRGFYMLFHVSGFPSTIQTQTG